MRPLAHAKKDWVRCNGGPWDGKQLLLPVPRLMGSPVTLTIIINGQRGRYIQNKHKHRVTWEPR